MNAASWVVLAGIVAAVAAAVLAIRHNKNKGGCCGDCTACGGCPSKERRP